MNPGEVARVAGRALRRVDERGVITKERISRLGAVALIAEQEHALLGHLQEPRRERVDHVLARRARPFEAMGWQIVLHPLGRNLDRTQRADARTGRGVDREPSVGERERAGP